MQETDRTAVGQERVLTSTTPAWHRTEAAMLPSAEAAGMRRVMGLVSLLITSGELEGEDELKISNVPTEPTDWLLPSCCEHPYLLRSQYT